MAKHSHNSALVRGNNVGAHTFDVRVIKYIDCTDVPKVLARNSKEVE